MAVGFLRRSISRGSSNRRSQARALGTRVSELTLCPLGQSKKAIGLESPIGPCVATHRVDNRQACCFRNDWRRHNREMEPQERRFASPFQTRRQPKTFTLGKTTLRVRVHVQTVGLNAETKKHRHRAEGEIFLLTFPFIGLQRFSHSSGTAALRDLWVPQQQHDRFQCCDSWRFFGCYGRRHRCNRTDKQLGWYWSVWHDECKQRYRIRRERDHLQ